jgi:hypothetical protein
MTNRLQTRMRGDAQQMLLALVFGLVFASPFSAFAQSRFYYAVENLDNGQVVRRDVVSSNGIPSGGLILAPQTRYRQWLFQADNGFIGFTEFTTPTAGSAFNIPATPLRPPVTPDSDGDGLSDDAEFVLGTNPLKRDTDDDGVEDGAAIQLGVDPGGGARTGIIVSVDTPGTAVDVCAFNDIAVIADSESGISVFNVFNRMSAFIMAQVDTPGVATAVSGSGNFIAVADGSAGLAVVDISDPPNASIIHQVNVGGIAQAVAAAGGLGFVGTAEGVLSVVDLATGVVVRQMTVGSVVDLAVNGETLYAFANGQLQVFTNAFGNLALAGSAVSPGAQQVFNGRGRISVGSGLAFLMRADGYNRFSVSNAAGPLLLNSVTANQMGWKQLALTGSGDAVVARGVNANDDGTHNISLYDVVNTATNAGFMTEFPTPGVARAVAIYNALAYVADSSNGLEVINYATADSGTNLPSISTMPSFVLSSPTNGAVEEGKLVRVTANATDDVQVRNVELYIDGVKAATDGNFPFEFQFVAPRRIGRTAFALQARASDTGGRFKFSDSVRVDLLPDVTPPRFVGSSPGNGTVVTNANSWFIYFDELLDPSSVSSTNLAVISAGPDGRMGTADDTVLTNALINFRDSTRSIVVAIPGLLPFGHYRLNPFGVFRDRAGNVVTNLPSLSFWVLQSGASGDDDNDGLTNADEAGRGTNPILPDTDRDGWTDGQEVEAETDPLNPQSRPSVVYVARPPIEIMSPVTGGVAVSAVTVACPPVEITIPFAGGASVGATVIALPPVEIVSPISDGYGASGAVVARPPVEIVSPVAGGAGASPVIVASPPVKIERQP